MEGKFWRSSRQNPPGVDATDSGLSHPGKSIWRPEHRDEGPVTSGHGIFGATTSLSQRGAQPLQVGDAVGQRVEGKTHEVILTDGGYDYLGKRYKSLSP